MSVQIVKMLSVCKYRKQEDQKEHDYQLLYIPEWKQFLLRHHIIKRAGWKVVGREDRSCLITDQNRYYLSRIPWRGGMIICIKDSHIVFKSDVMNAITSGDKSTTTVYTTVQYDMEKNQLHFHIVPRKVRNAIAIYRINQANYGRTTNPSIVPWLKQFGVQSGYYPAEWEKKRKLMRVYLDAPIYISKEADRDA